MKTVLKPLDEENEFLMVNGPINDDSHINYLWKSWNIRNYHEQSIYEYFN